MNTQLYQSLTIFCALRICLSCPVWHLQTAVLCHQICNFKFLMASRILVKFGLPLVSWFAPSHCSRFLYSYMNRNLVIQSCLPFLFFAHYNFLCLTSFVVILLQKIFYVFFLFQITKIIHQHPSLPITQTLAFSTLGNFEVRKKLSSKENRCCKLCSVTKILICS